MISRKKLADAVRVLSMDAIGKANSGHPGMPMGMADIAEVLWRDHLSHNPRNPHWPNRDRFILSNGHGSMLLYALLHLTGYDINMDDIRSFRQLGSKTPGHPEFGATQGVETTTGPLAQGLADAVGMAIGQKLLALKFNKPKFPIVDHFVYVFLGDGCLMEGLSHEAASLAGTHRLGKLIAFWDNNGISIDGDTQGWFTEDVPKRFEAYGWHVLPDVDGHDPKALQCAIENAKSCDDRPSLICCKTIIGYGSPDKAGTAKVHGSPLNIEEIERARKQLEWEYPAFFIPPEMYELWDAKDSGKQREQRWEQLFESYCQAYPELGSELKRRLNNELPKGWENELLKVSERLKSNQKPLATRQFSHEYLKSLKECLPELVGGSADLSPSNLTILPTSKALSCDSQTADYIHYGVREFAMSAIMNGLTLYGGFIPYGGTFLTFIDYSRSALRTAAIMGVRVIHVLTHDSIGVGEDGPTHQPIEHVASLRIIPNVHVWRPADSLETMVAWQSAIERVDGPTCLVLSRQAVGVFERDNTSVLDISRGGYILYEPAQTPTGIFIATGSEVNLAIVAAHQLAAQGVSIRVVSMPCCELFDKQDSAYKKAVLPSEIRRRVAIEAGHSFSWQKYVGDQGSILGIDVYGCSAPSEVLFEKFGFTVEKLIQTFCSLV